MKSENVKILKINFTDAKFKFDVTKKESLQLQIQTDSTLHLPKNNEDKTVLYTINIKMNTVDSDEIIINITADVIFELDEIPEDYNVISEETCSPMAINAVFAKMDDIIEIMGYPKFNIVVSE